MFLNGRMHTQQLNYSKFDNNGNLMDSSLFVQVCHYVLLIYYDELCRYCSRMATLTQHNQNQSQ